MIREFLVFGMTNCYLSAPAILDLLGRRLEARLLGLARLCSAAVPLRSPKLALAIVKNCQILAKF